MEAGAFNDNAVLPQLGVAATDLSDARRLLLRTLIAQHHDRYDHSNGAHEPLHGTEEHRDRGL